MEFMDPATFRSTIFKRRRVERQTELKPLKELAMEAFVLNIRRRLYVDVTKVPKELGPGIWQRLSKCAIIRTALNSNAVDWFSQNVIERPTEMRVNLTKGSFPGSVSFDFGPERIVIWDFRKDFNAYKFNIKIGEHELPTRIEPSRTSNHDIEQMTSQVLTTDSKAPMNVIQWLCQFFRRDIDHFYFSDPQYSKHWDLTKEKGSVDMQDCMDFDFATRIWPERQRKGWVTKIDGLQIEEPIQIDLQAFHKAGILTAHLNLTTSDFKDIISFYKQITSKNIDAFTKVPNWTSEQLESFKVALGLNDFSEELDKTHKSKFHILQLVKNFEKKMYKIGGDGQALVVYVNEKEPGVYDNIACTWWYEKY